MSSSNLLEKISFYINNDPINDPIDKIAQHDIKLIRESIEQDPLIKYMISALDKKCRLKTLISSLNSIEATVSSQQSQPPVEAHDHDVHLIVTFGLLTFITENAYGFGISNLMYYLVLYQLFPQANLPDQIPTLEDGEKLDLIIQCQIIHEKYLSIKDCLLKLFSQQQLEIINMLLSGGTADASLAVLIAHINEKMATGLPKQRLTREEVAQTFNTAIASLIEVYIDAIISSELTNVQYSITTVKFWLNRVNDLKIPIDITKKLMLAAGTGHTEIVKLLLTHKPNIYLQNKDGLSALRIAVLFGHTEIVKLLLTNIDLQNKDVWKALILATTEAHTEIVDEILKCNPTIDLLNTNKHRSLMIAATIGHTEIVKLLLARNPNVDVQDKAGHTALMLAAMNGHTETVKFLLKHNPNIDLQNNSGCNALMLATTEGHTEIVSLLSSYSSTVSLQNEIGPMRKFK